VGESKYDLRRLGENSPRQAITAAIGPEGGFIDEEFAMAVAAGWQPISLGPRNLRTETAALVVAACVCTFSL